MNSSLFIRYEKIHDHISEILDFLDLPEILTTGFTEKKERNSSMYNLKDETLYNLNNMYSDLQNKFETLKPYYVKKATSPIYKVFFSVDYIYAFLSYVYRSFFKKKQY
tara:strand:- start:183 stop:506 length:324 start_codon:yes stop_codon:yes gene_type:complete